MYENSIVTFIDILGFSDLVKRKDGDAVKQAVDAVSKFAMPDSDIEGELESFEPKAIQFSDSVIRVRPIDSGANAEYQIGILYHELLALVHAQAELANLGIFVRGGITAGEVFIEGNTVFGPAFIEAYYLESKYAIYPRIIIAPELLQASKSNPLLKARHHNTEDELEYIRKLIATGDDGIAYVDYVRAMAREVDEPGDFVIFLLAHRQYIIENAGKYSGIGNVSAKYMWLANYHNSVVRQYSDETLESFDQCRENLLVSSAEFPALVASDL